MGCVHYDILCLHPWWIRLHPLWSGQMLSLSWKQYRWKLAWTAPLQGWGLAIFSKLETQRDWWTAGRNQVLRVSKSLPPKSLFGVCEWEWLSWRERKSKAKSKMYMTDWLNQKGNKKKLGLGKPARKGRWTFLFINNNEVHLLLKWNAVANWDYKNCFTGNSYYSSWIIVSQIQKYLLKCSEKMCWHVTYTSYICLGKWWRWIFFLIMIMIMKS